MAKDNNPEQQASSTNVLLAQILQVAQDSNTTLKALLKVSSDSKDLLQQISDALNGGEQHVFTVKVIQLAKELKKELGV